MEQLIFVIFILVIFLLIIIVCLIKSTQYPYKFEIEEYNLKPYIFTELPNEIKSQIVSSNDNIFHKLKENETIIINGTIPYKYIYWSCSIYTYNPKTKSIELCHPGYSNFNLSGSANTQVFFIIGFNDLLLRAAESHIKKLYKKKTQYTTHIKLISLSSCYMPQPLLIGLHNISYVNNDILPLWTAKKYYTHIKTLLYDNQLYSPNIIKKFSEYDLLHKNWTDITKHILYSNGIFNFVELPIHLEYSKYCSNMIICKSNPFILQKDHRLVIYTLNHSITQIAEYVSLTLYHNDKAYETKTVSNIHNVKIRNGNKRVSIHFFVFNNPINHLKNDKFYITENIYTSQLSPLKNIVPLSAFIVNYTNLVKSGFIDS